mmetsp:Transcript_20851/g.34606  ORF Transcript_20851/g.34606 Transcript_20851/m.34606 type:complete len:518 (-) Transcript_20851:272-1825(-)
MGCCLSLSSRLNKPFSAINRTPGFERYKKYHEGKKQEEGDGKGGGGLGSFAGTCLVVNILMGSGFLALPHLIQEAGLILGPLCVIVAHFIMRTTAIYEADIMCRANAYARANLQPLKLAGMKRLPKKYLKVKNHAFTMSEMSEMFCGKRLLKVYISLLLFQIFFTLVGFTTVFSSTMSNYLSVPFMNGGQTCQFSENTLSSDTGCSQLRCFWIVFLGVVVVPLSAKGIKEQIGFQVFMTFLRFLVAFTMAATCLYAIVSGSHPFGKDVGVSQTFESSWSIQDYFNFGGVFHVFPVALFVQTINAFVNLVAHDLEHKDNLGRILISGMTITLLLYLSIGVTVAYYFYAGSIPQAANILWQSLVVDGAGNPLMIMAGFFVLLFPALDILSVFTINSINMASNMMAGWYHDRVDKAEQDRVIVLFFRLLSAVPPLLFGFWVDGNLDQVLALAGATAIPVAMIIPPYVNLVSQQKICEELGFSTAETPYSGWSTNPWVLKAVIVLGTGLLTTTVAGIVLGR